MIRCYDCRKEVDLGVLRCSECFQERLGIEPSTIIDTPMPGKWTRKTNFERDRYADDIAQPYTKHGHVNEKFVKKYGTNVYHDDVKDHYKKKGV